MKYKKGYADQLPELFAHGESVAEVAHSLDITKETFFQWVKAHTEFAKAYQKGKDIAEAWWEKTARESLILGKGERFNSGVWVFVMKNKFGWKDKTETDLTAGITLHIPPLPDKESADQFFDTVESP
jgi:hypothetical protein